MTASPSRRPYASLTKPSCRVETREPGTQLSAFERWTLLEYQIMCHHRDLADERLYEAARS